MNKFLWATLTVLLIGLVTASSANDAGYAYDAARGYYVYGGNDYNRVLVSYPSYTGCNGVCYPSYSFYQYYRVGPTPAATPAYVPPVQQPAYKDVPVPPYTPGWKEEFIKAQTKRDDLHAYLIASSLFGASGPLTYTGSTGVYKAPDGALKFMPYAQTGAGMNYQVLPHLSGTATFYGTNGNTQYQYQPTTVAALWNPTDTNSLFQMTNQQILGLQRVTGEQMSGFQQQLGQEVAGKVKVANMAITADGTVRIIQALQGPGTTAGYSFKFSQGGKVERIDDAAPTPPPVVTQDRAAIIQQWRAAAQQDCGKCHSNGVRKGSFDIEQFLTATPEQQQAVWKLLTTEDENRMMPRDLTDASKPGKRLPSDRIKLWLLVGGKQ